MTDANAPEPTPRRRQRQQSIAGRIRQMILERGLRPGQRLPSERELMVLFGASKGWVREALSALRSQGLIRTRTGSGGGVFLAEIEARHARALLSTYFLFHTPTDRRHFCRALQARAGAGGVAGGPAVAGQFRLAGANRPDL